MISKKEKKEIISELEDALKESKGVVFSSFKNITVDELREFRGKLREVGCKCRIAKKTLISRGVKKAELEEVEMAEVKGNVSVIYCKDDEVAPFREAHNFMEEKETFKVFKGFIDKALVGEEKIAEVAKLPNKETMRSMLVGAINSPVSGFVNVLGGNIRGLINVLNAKAKKV